MWCTNAGRSGNCGIDQVPLIFLPLHAAWEVLFAKGGRLQGIFLEMGLRAGKTVCVTRPLVPVSAFLTRGGGQILVGCPGTLKKANSCVCLGHLFRVGFSIIFFPTMKLLWVLLLISLTMLALGLALLFVMSCSAAGL